MRPETKETPPAAANREISPEQVPNVVCNRCHAEFRVDYENGGAIICPNGHAHGFLIGSKTKSIVVKNCRVEGGFTRRAD